MSRCGAKNDPRTVRGIGNGTVLTVKALGSFFAPHRLKSYADQIVGQSGQGSTATNGDRPVSVVGATRVAGHLAQDHRFSELLLLLIGINIFVAIFNMIPLLPFDGGHVAIAVYERLRSRRGRRYHADVAKRRDPAKRLQNNANARVHNKCNCQPKSRSSRFNRFGEEPTCSVFCPTRNSPGAVYSISPG